MRLADAHAHFFAGGYRSRSGILLSDEVRVYEGICRTHDISHVLAVGYEAGSYSGNNGHLWRLSRSRPWMIPLAYCQPTPAPSVAGLERWWGRRFAGVSLYVSSRSAAQLLARWPTDAVGALSARGAIVSINAPVRVWSSLEPYVRRLEGCHVLVSHLGLPGVVEANVSDREGAALLRPLQALASCKQVGVKASGFYACGRRPHDYPHRGSERIFGTLTDWFGTGRLYWGSDFSPALEHVSFAQAAGMLDHLPLTRLEKVRVAGENLRDLLRRVRR